MSSDIINKSRIVEEDDYLKFKEYEDVYNKVTFLNELSERYGLGLDIKSLKDEKVNSEVNYNLYKEMVENMKGQFDVKMNSILEKFKENNVVSIMNLRVSDNTFIDNLYDNPKDVEFFLFLNNLLNAKIVTKTLNKQFSNAYPLIDETLTQEIGNNVSKDVKNFIKDKIAYESKIQNKIIDSRYKNSLDKKDKEIKKLKFFNYTLITITALSLVFSLIKLFH